MAKIFGSEPAAARAATAGPADHDDDHEHGNPDPTASEHYGSPAAVPKRRANTVRSQAGRWPQHYLPALDTPIHVLAAFEYRRTPRHLPLPASHWADDELLNFLADRPVPTKLSPNTRHHILALKDADLGRQPHFWAWLFPIPDCELDTDSDPDGTPVNPPRMSVHFLLRYDSDESQRLRCHTHQNLERVWRLLGFNPCHPPNPTARTQLLPRRPAGQQGLGWDTDKASLIPNLISRVLRHLRLLGWAFEAELTYSALLEHMAPKTHRSAALASHEVLWRRIVRWELADHLLQSVCKHYLEAAIPQGQSSVPSPRDIADMVKTSPFAREEAAAKVDAAHDLWLKLQTDRNGGLAVDAGLRIEPWGRQPARDQYAAGLRQAGCPCLSALGGIPVTPLPSGVGRRDASRGAMSSARNNRGLRNRHSAAAGSGPPASQGLESDLATFVSSIGLAYDPARIPTITAGSAPALWLDTPSHPQHIRIAKAIVDLGMAGQQHRANELYNAVMQRARGTPVNTAPFRAALESLPEPHPGPRLGGGNGGDSCGTPTTSRKCRKRTQPLTVGADGERELGRERRRRIWGTAITPVADNDGRGIGGDERGEYPENPEPLEYPEHPEQRPWHTVSVLQRNGLRCSYHLMEDSSSPTPRPTASRPAKRTAFPDGVGGQEPEKGTGGVQRVRQPSLGFEPPEAARQPPARPPNPSSARGRDSGTPTSARAVTPSSATPSTAPPSSATSQPAALSPVVPSRATPSPVVPSHATPSPVTPSQASPCPTIPSSAAASPSLPSSAMSEHESSPPDKRPRPASPPDILSVACNTRLPSSVPTTPPSPPTPASSELVSPVPGSSPPLPLPSFPPSYGGGGCDDDGDSALHGFGGGGDAGQEPSSPFDERPGSYLTRAHGMEETCSAEAEGLLLGLHVSRPME